MYNFVDEEEFEIRDGIYYSKKKIMGRDFYIELGTPLGEYFAKILVERGVNGLKKYIGTNNYIKVLRSKVITVAESEHSCPRGIKFITGCYVFRNNSTIVYSGPYTRINYAEKHDNFSLKISDVFFYNLPWELRELIDAGDTRKYFKKFFRWDGFLEIKIYGTWGKHMRGTIHYRGEKREIKSDLKVGEYDIIMRAPFMEGVYAISSSERINLDEISVKNIGRNVKKRLLYGIGARYRFSIEAKRIYYDGKYPVVDFGQFKLYYDWDVLGIKTAFGMKWIDYNDWNIVEAGLVADGGDVITVLW